MNIFRPLKANEVEMRVSRKLPSGKKAWLLYKTARTDARLLDETVTPYRWNCSFEDIKGNLFCTISIKNDDGTVTAKSDCGTESKTEAEKGEASDAFKRAGFKWGIGRELYSAPNIILPASDNDYEKWYVDDIQTDPDREQITYLQIHHSGNFGYYEWKEGWKGMHPIGEHKEKGIARKRKAEMTVEDLYDYAKKLGWNEDVVIRASQTRFGLMPEELTEKQIAEAVEILKPKGE